MGTTASLTGRDKVNGECSDVGDGVAGTGVEGWKCGAGALVKDDNDSPVMDDPGGCVWVELGNDANVPALETVENSWG